MSGHYGARHRVLVLASLPALCAICGGTRRVRLVRGRAPGPIPCPHCVGRIPVVHLPIRKDIPKEAA